MSEHKFGPGWWLYFAAIFIFMLILFQNQMYQRRRDRHVLALQEYVARTCHESPAICAARLAKSEDCLKTCYPRLSNVSKYDGAKTRAKFYPAAYLTCVNFGAKPFIDEAQLKSVLGR